MNPHTLIKRQSTLPPPLTATVTTPGRLSDSSKSDHGSESTGNLSNSSNASPFVFRVGAWLYFAVLLRIPSFVTEKSWQTSVLPQQMSDAQALSLSGTPHTGHGLAVCKRLAKSLSADLAVSSLGKDTGRGLLVLTNWI